MDTTIMQARMDAHALWVASSGREGARADLRNMLLRDAILRGANLRDADLSGAILPDAPRVEAIDAAILAAIDAGGALNMRSWHTCDTIHCRAGWAIHLAGEPGRALEAAVGSSAAAALIYAASGSHPVPDWHTDSASALDDLRARAAVAV